MNQDTSRERFHSLEERLRGGRLGLSAVLLDPRGREKAEINFNADQYYPMASIVKVPIAMALVSEVSGGRASLDEILTVPSERCCPGPPQNPLDRHFYLPMRASHRMTVGELMRLMLVYSDNTAADAIMNRLAGADFVNEYVKAQGMDGVNLNRTLTELLVFYYDLPLRRTDAGQPIGFWARVGEIISTLRKIIPAYGARTAKDDHFAKTQEDSSTPLAMRFLLRLIATDPTYELVNRIMRACRTGNQRIKAALGDSPRPVRYFAHKTGSLGSIANDVGVIDFGSGWAGLISVMTFGSTVRHQSVMR